MSSRTLGRQLFSRRIGGHQKCRCEAPKDFRLTTDGSELVDRAFSLQYTIVAINSLSNATERSEHTDFSNLLKGFFGMFRNVTAHVAKIEWKIKEHDALVVKYHPLKIEK